MATRRDILAGLGAAALSGGSWAQQRRSPSVRSAVDTPDGQRNLAKYAAAVRKMAQLPANDPRSWTFQWYIHSVPTDRTKEGEIARLFPTASEARRLAGDSWSTCQAHFTGSDPDMFLPWHRAYLLCFERTVRSVLNDSGFNLPYWDYVDPRHRALPAQFLLTGEALFRPDRRGPTNAGQPIDAGLAPASPVNASALGQHTYRPQGPRLGFCQEIDRKLHGTIHTLVGNGRGMGSVPWAANDPIFWLHHANIDRLWASWNALGGINPGDDSFTSRKFTFPDGAGGRAVIKCDNLLTLEKAAYSYDRLQPGTPLTMATAAEGQRPQIEIGSSTARIEVPVAGAVVPLRRSRRSPGPIAAADSRLFLVLAGLSTPATPGVLYDVRIKDRNGQWTSVGFVNFFDAETSNHGPTHHGTSDPGPTFSFDVTNLLAGIGKVPDVRIVPAGAPDGGVTVSIGSVRLVAF